MDFIQYDMRIIDRRLEKQLLNKYTVGHVHNLGIFPAFGLHSNLISNHIAQLFAVLFTDPLSQTSCCQSSGLAYCNIGIGIFSQNVFGDLCGLTAASPTADNQYPIIINCFHYLATVLMDWQLGIIHSMINIQSYV